MWSSIGMREIGYAFRRLRSNPLFTAAATLTMAIAIGATASVFGLVDGVLLKAFPYREPTRVFAIWESSPLRQFPEFPVAPANYLDWCAQSHAFSGMAAILYRDFIVTGAQDPERVAGMQVTPSYFPVLGVELAQGRWLASDSGGVPEVVIGYGYWQRRFAGARSVLG